MLDRDILAMFQGHAAYRSERRQEVRSVECFVMDGTIYSKYLLEDKVGSTHH